MKKLIFGIIFFIVVAGGITVYTEWANRKFMSTLPEPPTVETPIDTHSHQDTHPHHYESDAPAISSKITEEASETMDEVPRKLSTDNIDEASETDKDRQVSEDWRTDDEDGHNHQSTSNPFGREIRDPSEIPPDELADMFYKGLLRRFGDMPEVHTFMALKRKKMKNESLSLDEHIDYTAAMLHLWPHPETKKTLDIFLEKRESEYPRSTKIVR